MSEKTMADVADKTVDHIDRFAAAVAKVAPQGWDFLVRAHRIEGITDLVVWLGFAAAAAFCLLRGLEWFKALRAEDGPCPSDAGVLWLIVGGCFTLVVAIAAVASGSETLTQIWAPEYTAGRELLQAVRQ